MTTPALTALQRTKDRHGEGCAAVKLALLHTLAHAPLRTAAEVLRLHEALCYLRAYPDDAAVLAVVERMLRRFHRRADLRQHREELADSGIAGTAIRYRFFWATACWFAERWPGLFKLDRDSDETGRKIAAALPLLLSPAEAAALRQLDLTGFAAIDRVRKGAGNAASDAAFWVRLVEHMPGDTFTRQDFHDRIDAAYVLLPGAGTPSRTHAWCAAAPAAFQTAPLARDRPDLREEIRRPPCTVRPLSAREGGAIVELARAAMVTRGRDLDAFAYGDPRDVRVVEFDDGLAFVAIGMRPERRLLVESVYGFLTIKNGVPIGYVLAAAVNESAEMAYNVFDTWRGHEAAHIYGRALAATASLLGAKAFSAPPYQLGHDNAEGLASGAWWFYQKLGFKPRDPAVVRLVERELAKMRRKPGYRSSVETLQELSSVDMFLERGAPRPDIVGVFPLGALGLAITDSLARRFGADREGGLDVCQEEAARALAVRGLETWSADERLAFRRWAPLVGILPGIDRWTAGERAALAAVIRAKGARYESDYVRAYNAHGKLRSALLRLARAAAT